jgi:hypothetical protein
VTLDPTNDEPCDPLLETLPRIIPSTPKLPPSVRPTSFKNVDTLRHGATLAGMFWGTYSETPTLAVSLFRIVLMGRKNSSFSSNACKAHGTVSSPVIGKMPRIISYSCLHVLCPIQTVKSFQLAILLTVAFIPSNNGINFMYFQVLLILELLTSERGSYSIIKVDGARRRFSTIIPRA